MKTDRDFGASLAERPIGTRANRSGPDGIRRALKWR
jgi:hypothetical protein